VSVRVCVDCNVFRAAPGVAAKVLHDAIGAERSLMTTIHAYTAHYSNRRVELARPVLVHAHA
jgi:glyceraldehyde-3-phosphate dehydrogenase/erythrose-4-phosphate dehydrogenase